MTYKILIPVDLSEGSAWSLDAFVKVLCDKWQGWNLEIFYPEGGAFLTIPSVNESDIDEAIFYLMEYLPSPSRTKWKESIYQRLHEPIKPRKI